MATEPTPNDTSTTEDKPTPAARTKRTPAASKTAPKAAGKKPTAPREPKAPTAKKPTATRTASKPAAARGGKPTTSSKKPAPKKHESTFGLKAAIATGIGAVGAVATAALLTLRSSAPKPFPTPAKPKSAHQADGADSSKSFEAGIADEGSIPHN